MAGEVKKNALGTFMDSVFKSGVKSTAFGAGMNKRDQAIKRLKSTKVKSVVPPVETNTTKPTDTNTSVKKGSGLGKPSTNPNETFAEYKKRTQ